MRPDADDARHLAAGDPTVVEIRSIQRDLDRLCEHGAPHEVRRHLVEGQVVGAVRALFPGVEDDALLDALRPLDLVLLAGEQPLFEQGDPGEAMFVVVSGRLRQSIALPSGVRELSDARPGDLVGDFSLLNPAPRSATARAVRDTVLLRIDRARFETLTEQFPQLPLALSRSIVDRVRRSNLTSPATRPPKVIAIAPLQPGVHREIDRQLELALDGGEQPVLRMTSRRFDAEFGRFAQAQSEHAQDSLLASLLAEQESHFSSLLFVTDDHPTPWTARCFRQADRIVFVSRATADPTPSPLEALAREVAPTTPRTLALIQPRGTQQPRGTARFLTPGRVDDHVHLREGEFAHVARLARRLSARSIGLVLSGGGARGYAHLGVWRAVEESGLPIDYLGGTSMGALLAAAFALPMTYDQVRERSSAFAHPRQLFDRTLPLVALMRSRKLNRMLADLYGETRIEDLWTPFFCLGTDLLSAEPVIFDRGLVREAVRCSISIPGVFVPVVLGDRVMVDGAVIDNFPVDEMKRRIESDRIIAVNVAPPNVQKRHYDLRDEVSGWGLALRRLNPFARRRRVPGIAGTLLRALEVNSVQRSRLQQGSAQLLLEPNVKSVGLLAFQRFEEASELGYQASKAAIEDWRASVAR